MLLIVHHAAEEPPSSRASGICFSWLRMSWASFSPSMVAWRDRLEEVGEPFARLTDREWMVLQGLMTEAGEKQLGGSARLVPAYLALAHQVDLPQSGSAGASAAAVQSAERLSGTPAGAPERPAAIGDDVPPVGRGNGCRLNQDLSIGFFSGRCSKKNSGTMLY